MILAKTPSLGWCYKITSLKQSPELHSAMSVYGNVIKTSDAKALTMSSPKISVSWVIVQRKPGLKILCPTLRDITSDETWIEVSLRIKIIKVTSYPVRKQNRLFLSSNLQSSSVPFQSFLQARARKSRPVKVDKRSVVITGWISLREQFYFTVTWRSKVILLINNDANEFESDLQTTFTT